MLWNIELPRNDIDHISSYKLGSIERKRLEQELIKMKSEVIEIPLIINGNPVKTNNFFEVRAPHDHSIVLAKAYLAEEKHLEEAINSAIIAQKNWSSIDWYHRVVIFKNAASLLAGPKRIENIAAIMLNHSKTPYEAEIDLAEMIDFLNFNAKYLEEIYQIQPNQSINERNRFDWRPLEGFVLAIPPFNFYSIGGNLPTAPAISGNVVLWKPARSVVFSNYKIMEVLMEAGLPAGVINFVPFNSNNSNIIYKNSNLAGFHFTGSYETLVTIYQTISQNLKYYKNIPRIVGETGGKDFIFLHSSANIQSAAFNIVRSGFEYQGQKCSACSRVYVPQSQWVNLKQKLMIILKNFSFGDIANLNCAGGAIINKNAYEKIVSYLDIAKENPKTYEIIYGGSFDSSKGWFISPCLVQSKDPRSKLMEEEIFGPIVTIYVYRDEEFESTLKIADETSPYALTGAIFAQDRYAIEKAEKILRFAAGNFYINDKPTGAIVSRQPFGGTRSSGTNDKAGSKLNLLRWLSPRTIKENAVAANNWKPPFLE
ncbi:2,5-dioxopentanoate dehydrogenase [Candidatus Lokiarchaeum ossiferum]|uniref:L-glutamate gamma-semialdehyde dehydrogenase n=1 Tax=Candidatus Lokiarchaeum ossiferum TaxID=2951803 RepID=A0ABY6HND4_9ARCH|nr:2,5-dioxopentanoate dehydrogenase [Candidatus Lokiarchaeum sp. B-35]